MFYKVFLKVLFSVSVAEATALHFFLAKRNVSKEKLAPVAPSIPLACYNLCPYESYRANSDYFAP